MSDATLSTDLTGKLLIAMPGMADGRFAHSVVFICAHSADGAMGLIVNKSLSDLTFAEMIDQLGISSDTPPEMPICFGGPVETGRGFVLHSTEETPTRDKGAALRVCDRFAMTATIDMLEDIASGTGPENAILALGYAGWGPGQLEAEIAENGWLTCDASPELVFDTAMSEKWGGALASLGIDPMLLSATAGHA